MLVIETLPLEILFIIFKYLKPKDWLNCSKVCQHWCDAVDCLPDKYWRWFCDQNRWVNRTYAERDTLPKNFNSLCTSYRDLYKSLTLWRKIYAAKLSFTKCPFENIAHYKLLNNTTLAILPDVKDGYSNVIIYYDLETFEERDRQCFDFLFHKYDENDLMISVVDETGNLYVMRKENKKCVYVGKLYANDVYPEYKLHKDGVYFNNEQCDMVVFEVKYENGSLIFKTKRYKNVNDHSPRSHMVHMVFRNCIDGCEMFTYLSSDFYVNSNITDNTAKAYGCRSDCIHHMYENDVAAIAGCPYFGFDWSQPPVYYWIKNNQSQWVSEVTKKDATSICRHGHIVVVGTKNVIHIYVNPYNQYGELKLYEAEPDRSIDIGKLCNEANGSKQINKIDVLEIKNGHRLLVLFGDELLQLEFENDDSQWLTFKQAVVNIVSGWIF